MSLDMENTIPGKSSITVEDMLEECIVFFINLTHHGGYYRKLTRNFLFQTLFPADRTNSDRGTTNM